jgi:general secretion pathway protein C
VGFRLTPGRDRDAFSSLGLEPGDVLTEVNGMILNDPQSAAQVFETLGEASMANVTLLRNGNPTVLTIDMSQIENLTENLQ